MSSILELKSRLNFFKYETNYAELKQDVVKPGEPCIVKLHPKARSSAFGRMCEYGLIAGYMQQNDQIKVLVLLTERESVDGDDDFMFADLNQIKPYKPEHVRPLTRI